MFVSYAQNGEDVVLWRALQHVHEGTYVDVGAADPTFFSVTRAFYNRGWRGLNVEPAPHYADLLEQERPRDVTARCGAAEAPGEAIFHVVEGTGLSTLDESLVPGIEEAHHRVRREVIDLDRLDAMLERHGFAGQDLHFLKVDVEGAEAQVLGGIDLQRWRPWIVVVEATRQLSLEPTHHLWEKQLLDAGYTFTLFDGLNRFYVANEHDELVAPLSFPAGVFDQPYRAASLDPIGEEDRRRVEHEHQEQLAQLRAEIARLHEHIAGSDAAAQRVAEHVAAVEAHNSHLQALIDGAVAAQRAATDDAIRWRSELVRLRQEVIAHERDAAAARHELAAAQADRAAAQAAADAARAQLDAVARTLSWRITRPIRVVRRLGRTAPSLTATAPVEVTAGAVLEPAPPPRRVEVPEALGAGFRERIDVVVGLLLGDGAARTRSVVEALDALERALGTSASPAATRAWLALCTVRGSYPDEGELADAARLLRVGGPRALVDDVERRFHDAIRREERFSGLEVVRDRVLVDVTHTAAHDLHTGIQRVVREATSRWLQRSATSIVQWNYSTHSVKVLSDAEAERMVRWRSHVHAGGTQLQVRALEERTGRTAIPWRCTFVLPELVAHPSSCSGYRALATAGLLERFSMIGYDFVPMTAAETVAPGMTGHFGDYLSLVKHATHLSAISESAAREFRAFNEMLASQGLPGPAVFADLLPTRAPDIGPADLSAAREAFDLGALPVVLVVGSHEPRKNHLVVLEAADRLWADGHRFDLVFAGGSGWGGDRFKRYVDELLEQGRPLQLHERVGEKDLWALYRLARFTVFPSLLEGFGLPVAESIASGTPAVTSDFGSMAEIAAGGGAVTVDPRDPAAVLAAMATLLTDDAEHARLAAEAQARRWGTWDDYAGSLWEELVG